jgi:uncharacterized membrane protein YdjX (TVP38/TMEM64 family)
MAYMSNRQKGILKLLAFVAILVTGVVVLRFTPLGPFMDREGIARGVQILRESPLAPLIFVPLYAGAVALAMPGSVLTLAGGAVFGLWWGTLYNTVGANIGANMAYALARFLGRDGIEEMLGGKAGQRPALERLDRAVGEHGFRGLLTLRLIPVVPFNALNFGAGLLGMAWSRYALATLIGILPGTFVYTMFADALLEGSTEASRSALLRMIVSGALLVFLSFLPSLMKRLRIRLPGASEATGRSADGGSPN